MTYSKAIVGLLVSGILALSTSASAKEIEFTDPTRPTAVIIAQNKMTEVTDFLVPYGILSASGAFNVVSVSTSHGLVNLWPNLAAEMTTTLSTIDDELPNPPDLIVVPAVHDYDDPILTGWLQTHAARGALIVSVCDGVFVTAAAGLLDGRAATGHFYSADERKRLFAKVDWVKDARYVESGNIMSTSGVSASAPASLRLVEKFAGAETAQKLAATYGVDDFGPSHDSSRFEIGADEAWTFLANVVRINSDYDVVLKDGIDEYSLGFALDLLSRTLRVSVGTVGKIERIRTAHGLTLIPSRLENGAEGDLRVEFPVLSGDRWISPLSGQSELAIENPANAIDTVLSHIKASYGPQTAKFTATQLEFVWPY